MTTARERLEAAIRRGCAGAHDIDDIVAGVTTELLSTDDDRIGWLLRGDVEAVYAVIQIEHVTNDDGNVFHETVSEEDDYDDE